MRVFVAGATGVLGRRLVRQLAERGHAVAGIARDDAGEKTVLSCGGDPKRADLFDVDSLAKAAEGAEVVVHAATAIPTKLRTSPRDWALNDRIRREGTRALSEAAGRVRAKAYFQQGIVWAVHSPDGSPYDEDAPPVSDRILASSLDGELIAQEAGRRHGFEAGVLRLGGFYSADGWHTRTMAEAVARKRPAMVRRGTAVWSFIHAEDAARAFVSAVEAPRTGVWHVVDDRPTALRDFLGAMARRLNAPPPRSAPLWVARIALGRYTAQLLGSSFTTSNARFHRDFGWRPHYPTYEQGLDEVVSAWQAERFPPGTA